MPLLGATGGGSAKGFGALANLGYFIRNSLRLRFNSTSGSTSYLSRTNSSSPTNNKIGTLSFWLKRGIIGSQTGNGQYLIETGTGTSDNTHFSLVLGTTDVFSISQYTVEPLLTTRVFRDPAAWYHIVFVFDSTQGTAADRYKLYINGVLETAVTRPGSCPLNSNWAILNSGQVINIGRHTLVGRGSDVYLAEWNLIDGQALTPADFGKTDAATGQWIPKKYVGTYGTNGYYLKFSDIATTSGSNAGLGRDFSGNGNYWTTNNISVTSGTTYDAMIDSPTLSGAASNYCVLNRVAPFGSSLTLSEGNLKSACAGAYWASLPGTFLIPSTGKWYWEVTPITANFSTGNIAIGITKHVASNYNTGQDQWPGFTADSYGMTNDTGGTMYKWTSATPTSYGSQYAVNDIIGVALNMDAGTLTYYKNGVSQGVAFSSLTGNFFPSLGVNNTGTTAVINFGQRPFSYTPPTDHKALNTFNLP